MGWLCISHWTLWASPFPSAKWGSGTHASILLPIRRGGAVTLAGGVRSVWKWRVWKTAAGQSARTRPDRTKSGWRGNKTQWIQRRKDTKLWCSYFFFMASWRNSTNKERNHSGRGTSVACLSTECVSCPSRWGGTEGPIRSSRNSTQRTDTGPRSWHRLWTQRRMHANRINKNFCLVHSEWWLCRNIRHFSLRRYWAIGPFGAPCNPSLLRLPQWLCRSLGLFCSKSQGFKQL